MAISIRNYVIDQAGVDWSAALAGWSWLLPPKFSLLLINRFCDLFIANAEGAVCILDVGAGTLKEIADSSEDFKRLVEQRSNADEWLRIPLVKELTASSMLLKPVECYGLKLPPVFGGRYTIANCFILAIPDYLRAYASIHNQLRSTGDGTQDVAEPE